MNNKIKFDCFKYYDGSQVSTIHIYLGNLNLYEWLDDVMVEMSIVDGDIKFTILEQEYYDENGLKHIKDALEEIEWDGGYEFIGFCDIRTNQVYSLIGNRNSEIFNILG